MNICLTPSGGKAVYLCLLPEKVKYGGAGKFMTYSIISLGDVKIPRGSALEEVSWKAIFPGRSRIGEPHVKSEYWIAPIEYIGYFRKWRDNGTKVNIKITDTGINMDVYVEKFEGEFTGGHGDYEYSITLIEAQDITITAVSKKSRASSKKSKKSSSKKYKTYKVKKGDTVAKIAQKKLKKTSRYKEIYKLNKKVIEKAAKKHGRKSSKKGKYLYAGTKLKIPKK